MPLEQPHSGASLHKSEYQLPGEQYILAYEITIWRGCLSMKNLFCACALALLTAAPVAAQTTNTPPPPPENAKTHPCWQVESNGKIAMMNGIIVNGKVQPTPPKTAVVQTCWDGTENGQAMHGTLQKG